MNSSLDFDRVRAAFPLLGFGVYALEGGDVTLEVHAADGRLFRFAAPTLAACLAKAFPSAPASIPPTQKTETHTDLFS